MVQGMCQLCYRPAITTLTAGRRPLWRVLLGRPRRTIRVCGHCLADGIARIRRG
jgi:hypothetical protein